MEDLAVAVDEAMFKMEEFTAVMVVFGKTSEAIAPGLSILIDALEPYKDWIKVINDNMVDLNVQLPYFNENLSRFSNLISNFKFPSFGGGGGGDGGDDDDTWWNPFD